MIDFIFSFLLRIVSWRMFLLGAAFLAVAWLLSELKMAGVGVFFYAFVATIVVGGGLEIWRMIRATHAEHEWRRTTVDADSPTRAARNQMEGKDDVRS